VAAASIDIRTAEPADLVAVHRIERASFEDPWPYRAFSEHLDAAAFLVAADAESGRVVGFILADLLAHQENAVGHIKDFAVAPEMRNQGIGTRLLTGVLTHLRVAGAHAVSLEVRASNDAARNLYRSFGFEPAGREEGYYHDDEDAVLMLRQP